MVNFIDRLLYRFAPRYWHRHRIREAKRVIREIDAAVNGAAAPSMHGGYKALHRKLAALDDAGEQLWKKLKPIDESNGG